MPLNVHRISFVCALLATLVVSGCRGGNDTSSNLPPRHRPPLRAPREGSLEKEKEAAVMDWMDDLRGDDYLKRVKAEEELDKLMKEDPVEVAPYLVQLLDEPQLDIRVAVIRLFMKYGRGSTDAVEMLIEVVNDAGMSVALCADASRTLREWTGKDFGYRAWTDPEGVEEAGRKWRVWYGRTGGYIPPLPLPPSPPAPPAPPSGGEGPEPPGP